MKRKLNKQIGIGISTFLRDKSLFRLITSINKYYPEIKIYIADQGNATTEKDKLYKQLKKHGHEPMYIPFDIGISASRRILKEKSKEDYLVYMEDDFEVTSKTNLYKMQEILQENKDIGIVGGNLEGYTKTGAYSYFFCKADDKLCYIPLDYLVEKGVQQWHKTTNDINFLYADIVSDFTMWKKEVPNIFDDNVKTIEHSHVYLLIKYKTNFKVVFCPDTEIRHAHDRSNVEYNQFRGRKKELEYLKHYWGDVEFYQFSKSELLNFDQLPPVRKSILKEPKENKITTSVVSTPIESGTSEESLLILFNFLTNDGIDFYLLGETCLRYVYHLSLGGELYVGIKDKNQVRKILNKANVSFIDEECCIINNIKIHLIPWTPIKYKIGEKLGDIFLKVPFPVVTYLQKSFGENYLDIVEKIKNEK